MASSMRSANFSFQDCHADLLKTKHLLRRRQQKRKPALVSSQRVHRPTELQRDCRLSDQPDPLRSPPCPSLLQAASSCPSQSSQGSSPDRLPYIHPA